MKRVMIAAIALTATSLTYAQTGTTPTTAAPAQPEATQEQPKAAQPNEAIEAQPEINQNQAQEEAVQQPADTAAVNAEVENGERTPVSLDKLPEPVKKSLASADYAGWKPVAAYWVKNDKAGYYEIEATKGAEKTVIRLDEQGQKAAK